MSAALQQMLDSMHHPSLELIAPGLERVTAFLDLLGAPHRKLPPVVHVAGTNGKGSTLAYLQAMLEQAGYAVHRYSSPHLVRFNERIILRGRPIADDALMDVLARAKAFIERCPVTAFESTTAAALLAFAEQPADILLLETGMGGRLDATNVVDRPLLTAITPVDMDHAAFLGENIVAIAGEKAGIIKAGVPCVLGRQAREAAAVLAAKAQAMGAPLFRLGQEWQVSREGEAGVYRGVGRSVRFVPALAGEHQFDNAAVALACVEQLKGFSITDAQAAAGIAATRWPARLQRLSGRLAGLLPPGVELWLDGGHNPQGGRVLAEWLAQRGMKAYFICGMIKGKDTQGFLGPLAPYIAEIHCVTIPGEAQTQPGEQVQMAARGLGVRAFSAESVEKALQSVAERAKNPAIVCICGSLSLAGKVLAANEGE